MTDSNNKHVIFRITRDKQWQKPSLIKWQLQSMHNEWGYNGWALILNMLKDTDDTSQI